MAAHFAAWLLTAALWLRNWAEEGPAPSGPAYNTAKHFIEHLDPFVWHTVQEWTIRIATSFPTGMGTAFTITYAILILLAGTLQWFLLGRLIQWTDQRLGRKPTLTLFGLYALLAATALLRLLL